MVDSRQKGARNESALKKLLIEKTELNWQRVPGSGALDTKHGLKGDLYIPNEKNVYCIEVKAYKESVINHTLLTSKNPQLDKFWEQAVRQGNQTERIALLIFKHDRSKWFVMIHEINELPSCEYLEYSRHGTYIMLLEDWLEYEKPEFIK